MNALKIDATDLLKMFSDVCIKALDDFYQKWDKYELENDGESPDWPSPILYFDGVRVRYFDEGDAQVEADTQGYIRIGAVTLDRMTYDESLQWLTNELAEREE